MITYCPYDCPGRTMGKTCCANKCFNTNHRHIMNDPTRRPKNPFDGGKMCSADEITAFIQSCKEE